MCSSFPPCCTIFLSSRHTDSSSRHALIGCSVGIPAPPPCLSGQLLEEAEKGSLCSCWKGRSPDGEERNSVHWQVTGRDARGGVGKVNVQCLWCPTDGLDDTVKGICAHLCPNPSLGKENCWIAQWLRFLAASLKRAGSDAPQSSSSYADLKN